MQTTNALLLLCILLIAIVVIRYRSAKKKYEHPDYLQQLETIKTFIEEVNSLNDYVTWVARDGIKNRYALAGRYFKNKTYYYKKELAVKEFNAIYGGWDEYICFDKLSNHRLSDRGFMGIRELLNR